jgi:hypothetical protein
MTTMTAKSSGNPITELTPMDIRHIRHVDGKETRVEYTNSKNGDVDEHKMTTKQKPETSFTEALAAFEPLVLKWLKLDKAWTDGFTVTGVSFSESKAKGGRTRMGIIVVCRYTPDGSPAPMFINTPLLKESLDDAEVNKEGFIPASWDDQIEELRKQAIRFLQGKRFQKDLPFAKAS